MRATPGGADQCSGGTASASSSYSSGYLPANAFNNTPSDEWASGITFPHWIRYQFAAPVEVQEVAIQATDAAYSGSNEQPRSFTIEYSDDGTVWYAVAAYNGIPGWAVEEARAFPCSPDYGISYTPVGFSLPLTSDYDDTTGKFWSVSANVAISGGEAVLSGSSTYLRSQAGADFAFGRSDFTLEGFYRETSSSGTQCLYDGRNSASGYGLALYSRNAGGISVSGNAGVVATATGVFFTSTSQHFAMCRQGSTLRVYVNGMQILSSTAAAVSELFGGGGAAIGGSYLAQSASGQYAIGAMKHLRATRGTCLYPNGTTFTPPSVPFAVPVGSAPSGAPGTHRYWRLLITDNDGHATYYGMTEWVVRDKDLVVVSGYNSTSVGITASSAINGSNSADKAFDRNITTTGWLSANKTPDQWLKADFGRTDSVGCPVMIKEFDIYGSHNVPTASPKDFKLQWSDNDSTWTDALVVTGETGWAANEKRTFVVY